jgi:hypothetical protein
VAICSYGSKTKKWYKRFANRIVRRSECPNGKQYRKLFCSWNIVDYRYDYSHNNHRLNQDIDEMRRLYSRK